MQVVVRGFHQTEALYLFFCDLILELFHFSFLAHQALLLAQSQTKMDCCVLLLLEEQSTLRDPLRHQLGKPSFGDAAQ